MNRQEMKEYITSRIPDIARNYKSDTTGMKREWEFLIAVQNLLIETDTASILQRTCVHKHRNKPECNILDGLYCAKECKCQFHDNKDSWEEKQRRYPLKKDYVQGGAV